MSEIELAELDAGDVLYIPSYWWHQTYNTGRTIAVTTWFDYFGKQSILGDGQGLPNDYRAEKLRDFRSSYGMSRS